MTNNTNQQQMFNGQKLSIELLPYLQKRTPKEQVACISLVTLHLQNTISRINSTANPQKFGNKNKINHNRHFQETKANRGTQQELKQIQAKELEHKHENKLEREQMQEQDQEHKQELEREQDQEQEQKLFHISGKRQKRIFEDFVEQSESDLSDEEDDEDYLPHQDLKRKRRNSLKGVKRTKKKKCGKRKKSYEARPIEFAKLRVFWSDHECNCLIDGVVNYGIGKWSKIKRNPGYSFHSKRTPHDLKDKWRNLTKIDSMQTIQLKYNYNQWLNRHKMTHLN
ncbi:telomeric repeat-binding factor 1 terf1 [Anaeramoeba flamelloides]|uniref:Telomeric repeat-binding factor 1 terf1 n=1 Tax=Anaeramoeba flamelloides TaxID=1746091 RepID=A0AAV8ADG8_9EUKA|nr:telomeric repeat-binding factor 1 terf1 [Anaeramoeba flamelloides]